ncbi:MAG: hypothetical protein LN412_01290, partial [Candidatus Thermoplasmatota archaeon]|nr:hypothetical protein [Candidatus Thermoplasmatota archaeon]
MDTTTFNKILDTLSREYPPKDWTKGMRPFEVLVSVVISQNTAVANERRALKELRRRVGITPEALAKAPLRDLEEALRPAGLHRTRARRLKEIATLLSREHGGDLPEILRRPMEQARDALLSLPGVGPKTAFKISKELGVSTVEDLEKALKSGSVAGLPGLGEKAAANILRHVQTLRTKDRRVPLGQALAVVEEIIGALRACNGI